MEENEKTIKDFVEILKRRKWGLVLPALIIFLIAVVVAFALPPIYRSTATILIEEQELPKEYATSMVTSYVDQRIQSYTQRIMSSSRLMEIINRFNLYRDLRQKTNLEEIIEKMRKDIKFDTIVPEVDRRTRSSTVAFMISYDGENPETVQQVANTLASIYLQENLKVREEKTAGASKFMEDEMKEARASLASQDAKIAEYKEKHISALPELSQMNYQELERLERNIEQFDIQLRYLKEREGYLQTQLASTPRYPRSLEKDRPNENRPDEYRIDIDHTDKDRLKELEIKLDYLKALYTERHPDVIKIKREIANLERKIQISDEEAVADKPKTPASKPKTPASKPKTPASKPETPTSKPETPTYKNPAYRLENPAYVTISSQLWGTQAEIESIKKQIQTAGLRRQEYVLRIQRSPRVEEAYRSLIGERNNLQIKYDDLMKKYMETKVASGMEKEQMGERFTLIDPPRLPVKPIKPNVPAILLIGFFLGIGGGIGTVSLREYSDQSVRNAEAFTLATGFTVLASIPDILTPRDIARKEKKRTTLIVSIAVLIIIGVAVFHFVIMDLDVFWAKLMRKLVI